MTPRSIDAILRISAAAVALVILVAFPAVTYLSGRHAKLSVLETESRMIAQKVTEFISEAPTDWEYQALRLNFLLRIADSHSHKVELRGPTDAIIAAESVALAPPVLTVRYPVYDYGRPVATVAVSSSQRPLLALTGGAGLLGLLIAAIIYFPLRNIPLRALHHSQEALQRLNAELDQRVRERTAELESANRELETFSYSVAHDLRAPLRGIDGYSQLLLADHAARLDDEGRGFLQNIVRATQHMGQLIDDLLAYSRLERRDMEISQVDLQALIESLLAQRADEIKARGVAVSVAVDCPAVRADREGLAMALRNLLENALKFTRDVPLPMISLSGRDTGATCIVAVRDNGVGFNMKFHDRIFGIFQRLLRSEDYPGTGVGLAIVQKAMERMGGRVWAESELGKGSTFYLEISK